MSHDLTSEVDYRPIDGFPGYRVGSDGSIWSSKRGRWHTDGPWRQRKPNREQSGYLGIQLWANGSIHKLFIHRIVLTAFVCPCPPGMEVAHQNGIKDDNRLSNLRWDTHSGNHADKHRHGTMLIGASHPNSKLTIESVSLIWEMHAQKRTATSIANRIGVSDSTVRDVIHRRTWAHVDPRLISRDDRPRPPKIA